jgi:hypothetical protein
VKSQTSKKASRSIPDTSWARAMKSGPDHRRRSRGRFDAAVPGLPSPARRFHHRGWPRRPTSGPPCVER